MTTSIHPRITLARVEDACRRQTCELDNPGFCLACGSEQEGCEPDARNYECEECGSTVDCGECEGTGLDSSEIDILAWTLAERALSTTGTTALLDADGLTIGRKAIEGNKSILFTDFKLDE